MRCIMNSYGKDNVIAKALFNKVISEDVAEKLTVDELLCLNRLMFICDNFYTLHIHQQIMRKKSNYYNI